ncbi:MAG: N-acetyltransferase [Chloroflexi bacterium]|nr:N-acetyltransferase [Chloroflexota bacterium]MBI5829011.1 N-acetyltransferase [Chloroflexota bacterium]
MKPPAFPFKRDEAGRMIADEAAIGDAVHLGNHVAIYPRVRIGDRSVIMDGAVLGRVPLSNSTVTRPITSAFSDLIVGNDSIIGCNAVLYTGCTLGRQVMVGDLSSIREGCTIGDGAVIGRGVMMLYDSALGRFSRIQDQAHLVGNMVIEEHVFIGMGVITTNDNEVYLSRFGIAPAKLRGPTIRKFAVIGAGATLLPNIEIGVGALVGAGAVVTKDVPPWTVVAGSPARHVKNIPDDWQRSIERHFGL